MPISRCVPSSRHPPCLCLPCRVVARGLPAVFLEGCADPHRGSWDISLLLEPGQTALGKASPLPWESPARRSPCLARLATQLPGVLVLWHVPSAAGPSRVRGQWHREVPWGLCPAHCLLPSALASTPCVLAAAGSLPQSPPKGSSTALGYERGSPKLGLPSPPAWG